VEGIVFHIQRFSVHDGPGIRTTVFLKGCSLACAWCHNPEGISPKPQLRYFTELCIACGQCSAACPESAQEMREARHVFHRQRCNDCGRCVPVCPSGALLLAGQTMSVEQVMGEILTDRVFYRRSGGGVTLSGGEPVQQHQFSLELLASCRAEGINTALETAGHYPWRHLEALLRVTDLVMMDIKHMDSERHRAGTGAGNARILENSERLVRSTGKPVVFRIPVIPSFNDRVEDIIAIRRFVEGLRRHRDNDGSITLELLPFHPLGRDKYQSLEMEDLSARYDLLSGQRMQALREAARVGS
jgi:pyruvate formate lyase activating enzyme